MPMAGGVAAGAVIAAPDGVVAGPAMPVLDIAMPDIAMAAIGVSTAAMPAAAMLARLSGQRGARDHRQGDGKDTSAQRGAPACVREIAQKIGHVTLLGGSG